MTAAPGHAQAPGPVPVWRDRGETPIDLGGPVDQPYDREAAEGFETRGGIEVIEAVAQRAPHRVAVYDGRLRLTYGEFMDRVYGLAAELLERTRPGAPVAALVHNTAASPIIIMACAMVGRILVPIDAGHPRERQTAIFAQSGAEALMLAADDDVADDFIPADLPRINVAPRARTGASRPDHAYDPNLPLFVGFTSGSSAQPKGIVGGGRYGGMVLRHFIDMFHINPSDTVLGLASLSTGGARDTFAALGAGAMIRVFDMRTGFADALRALDEDRVTVLSFVPAPLRMVLQTPRIEQAFRHLRILDLHGERTLASDIALMREKLPAGCQISVTMGSVEAGAVFSWFVQDDLVDGPVVPVGRILPGRRIALLDDEGRPVADGEPGELFVRGPMSLGAWQGGRITQGPFLEDPERSDAWIYPMGDIMRRRPDGLYEFIGRNDRKVKVRGLWADLGEVESAIRSMGDVADVVVMSLGEEAGGERLCAFLAPVAGRAPPTAGEVRRVVARDAAPHMAPAEVRVLPEIPRLANFKPDLPRLRAMI